jgi:hypothetical protein
MDIDETWSPRIQVREEIVEFEKVDRVWRDGLFALLWENGIKGKCWRLQIYVMV